MLRFRPGVNPISETTTGVPRNCGTRPVGLLVTGDGSPAITIDLQIEMVERYDANFRGRRRERIDGLKRRGQVAQRIVQWRHDEGRPVLRVSIEILAGKLSHAYGDAIVQPSLLDPPRIEAGRVGTHQAAGPGHEPEIQSEIASSLRQSGRVEVPSVVPCQRAKIDVDGGAEAVPDANGEFC